MGCRGVNVKKKKREKVEGECVAEECLRNERRKAGVKECQKDSRRVCACE